MATKTRRGGPEQIALAIGRIVDALADPVAVRDAYGAATAAEIRKRGARTWLPRQAHLVASSIDYADGRIAAATGRQAGQGTVGALLFGAEFGSSTFRQFGPRRSGGTWLFPTIEAPPPGAVDDAADALDDLIAGAL
jgi:hypothetical protein